MSDAEHVNRYLWRDRICEDPDLTDSCFRVAYMIAGYVNEDKGCAWPSLSTLAARLGVSRKTIRRAVASLEHAGYLHVTRKGRQSHSNEYRLRLPDSRHNSPAGEDRPVPSRVQSCPETGDRDVPQYPLMNPSRTLQGDKQREARFAPGIAGQPKATRPSYGRKRRGQTELVIASRLGAEGMDRLSACDEETVSRLCTLQQQGRLSDQQLFEVFPPWPAKTFPNPEASEVPEP